MKVNPKMKSVLLAATLSLCAAPARAQDQMTPLPDWFVNPDHVPVIIAQKKGYFAEQDLAGEVNTPAAPSAPPWMVAAGQADLAISYQPQLHLQIHEGLPVPWVGTLPRFALRPTAVDTDHYATFEVFLHDAVLIPAINPVSDISIEVTA